MPVLLQLDPASDIPLYRQIRDQLRQLISTGALAVGDRLPPSRELASRLGVHRTTVANAYAELTADGWISGHVGRGTFIAKGVENHKNEETARPYTASLDNGYLWTMLMADAPSDEPLDALVGAHMNEARAIAFTTARPAVELIPLEEFRRATSEVLRREGRALLQLGPSDGYPPLKDFLRGELRRQGIVAGERELLITNGCQQALDLVRKVFVRPGDTVAMENPIYPGAIQTFHGGGVRCLGVPVTENGVNVDALDSLLTRQRVRLMMLTPDFQNPTGATLPLDARQRVLELAARHQVPIVEDGIYSALRLRGRETPSLKALDAQGLVIHINSFSKVCFSGLRVGWMVASEPVIERLRLAKQATDLHTDQLAQAALAEFGRRGWLGRLVKKARALYRSRLARMEAALEAHFPEEAAWTRPEGGMSVWVALPAGMDASGLLFKAREQKVLFTPGRYFYFQAVQPNTLRLGFAAVNEKQIGRGIEILGDLIKAELRHRRRAPEAERAARVALV
ncbi:MAG TPA: PLP-dependent aminotransferase family protein [Candidatus Xenobia bacterium]|nr:PLP-dependent aminotransferase family protein [Candidatus Xenobia bacterium]